MSSAPAYESWQTYCLESPSLWGYQSIRQTQNTRQGHPADEKRYKMHVEVQCLGIHLSILLVPRIQDIRCSAECELKCLVLVNDPWKRYICWSNCLWGRWLHASVWATVKLYRKNEKHILVLWVVRLETTDIRHNPPPHQNPRHQFSFLYNPWCKIRVR